MLWRNVGGRGIAPLILNLDTGGEWSALGLACFSPVRDWTGGCVRPTADLDILRLDLSSQHESEEAVSCVTRWTILATIGGIAIN